MFSHICLYIYGYTPLKTNISPCRIWIWKMFFFFFNGPFSGRIRSFFFWGGVKKELSPFIFFAFLIAGARKNTPKDGFYLLNLYASIPLIYIYLRIPTTYYHRWCFYFQIWFLFTKDTICSMASTIKRWCLFESQLNTTSCFYFPTNTFLWTVFFSTSYWWPLW